MEQAERWAAALVLSNDAMFASPMLRNTGTINRVAVKCVQGQRDAGEARGALERRYAVLDIMGARECGGFQSPSKIDRLNQARLKD